MQAMQQVTYAAKGLAGLVAGWVLGFALMLGVWVLSGLLGYQEAADRALLGGMLLAIGVLAVMLISASLAERRRVPAWLLNLLLGMATAPPLSIFACWSFWWTWSD